MKEIISSICCLLLTMSVFAQQSDSLRTSSLDSLSHQHMLDSLQQLELSDKSIDSLLSTSTKLDSLTKLTFTDSLDLAGKVLQKVISIDSLGKSNKLPFVSDTSAVGKATKLLSDPNKGLAKLKPTKLTAEQDSVSQKVSNTKNKLSKLQKNINDAPQNIVDSVAATVRQGVNEIVSKPQEKLNSINNDVKESQNKLQQKQQEGLEKISGKADGKLPDDKLDKVTGDLGLDALSEKSSNLGVSEEISSGMKIDSPVADLDISKIGTESLGVEIPKLDGVGQDILPDELNTIKDFNAADKLKEATNIDFDANEVKESVNEVSDVAKESLDKVRSNKELKEVKEQVGTAGELSKEAGGYGRDLSSIKNGDFDKIESQLGDQATNIREIKQLEEQKAVMDKFQKEHQQRINGYREYEDKDVLLAKMKEQGRALATSHFAGQQEQLKAGHQQLATLKKKYDYVPSITEIEKRKPNILRTKPHIDRFVFGLDLEGGKISEDKTITTDLGPFVGYRFNPRASIYIGNVWKYKVVVDGELDVRKTSNAGFRGRFDYYLLKDFSATGIIEQISQAVDDDNAERKNHYGIMLGVNKKYRVRRHIYGQGQILYNFGYDRDGPYARPLNVRFGFYFNKTSSKSRIIRSRVKKKKPGRKIMTHRASRSRR